MAERSQARAVALLAALFLSGIAAGHWLARYTAVPPPPPGTQPELPGETAAPAEAPATRRMPNTATAPAAAAAAAPAQASAALPPRDLPVSSYFDELSRQAAAGDGPAARRLADDLYECATRKRQLDNVDYLLDRSEGIASGPPPAGLRRAMRGGGRGGPPRQAEGEGEDVGDARMRMAERMLARAQESEQRCAGLSQEQIDKSAELIRDAALAGDNQARLCYALAPNEWRRDTLSPGWADYAERWQAESPQMVRQAFESGLPEAAAVLASMYSPWQQRSMPWTGQLGDDPYWAYAYAAVARDVMPAEANTRWTERLLLLGSRLSSAQVAQAEAWAGAARRRVDFGAPLSASPDSRSFCDMVRMRGGFR